ncbi:mitochondrial import protein Pam17 [Neoconidiobolus thromboides FSU 785]|nr:mitochondrial import protein Pam17 [Neoconidiobolus thromboides FSU 785]
MNTLKINSKLIRAVSLRGLHTQSVLFKENTEIKSESHDASSMSWTDYFQYKKQRQLRDQLLSYPSAFIASGATGSYLMTNVTLDPSSDFMIYGMDPMIVFILASGAAGFTAFLTTPLLGSLAFKLLRPKINEQLALKDADFYKRIAKYRVNMAIQPRSVTAPPDYYGEKIKSIKDYRHWLRRQFDYKRQMGI